MTLLIYKKIQYGDIQTLAKCLDISADAAKQRYYRKDQKAIEILQKIIENREALIASVKTELSECQ